MRDRRANPQPSCNQRFRTNPLDQGRYKRQQNPGGTHQDVPFAPLPLGGTHQDVPFAFAFAAPFAKNIVKTWSAHGESMVRAWCVHGACMVRRTTFAPFCPAAPGARTKKKAAHPLGSRHSTSRLENGIVKSKKGRPDVPQWSSHLSQWPARRGGRLSLTSRAFPVSGEPALRLFLRYSCEARSAWSRSSLMSSMFSIPTETRI